MEEEICRASLAIELDSYGRGATNVRAHLLDDDLVVVLLDGLKLQPSEEFLVEEGRQEAVIAVRNQFEQAIAASFKAAVERATGRTVVGVSSR